ncbi:MAG: DUF3501 family protein [Armatimonadota bacterium]|nr:DUF3501 family protein [Armatimonadota bacterium]MDR7528738.1 DUF3501 family protein [Armatimonadota bacterium]
MDKIRFEDVRNLVEYEKVRPAIRAAVIALKRDRRVPVGDRLSVVFENRDTVLFQIQEMVRAERLVDEARIREEIACYNELIPDPGELSATLFIEIEDRTQIRPILDRFLGIDQGEHVWLEVGGTRVPARFAPGRSREDRISAVHFLRFAVPETLRTAFKTAPLALVVEHPACRGRTPLGEGTRRALLEDLGWVVPAPVGAGGASA